MKAKLFVVLLVILNAASYFYEGYFAEASLLFNGFYFATLFGSAYILCRLKMKPLVIFSGLTIILGVVVEYVNTEAGNWAYLTGGQPPLFVAVGWVSLIAIIFYGSNILKKYVSVSSHRLYPVLVCCGLFFLFSYAEGNITGLTIGLYIVMALLGIYSSFSRTCAWSVSLFVTGVIVGSISEALGASCMLWSFRSGGLLPLPMVVAWSVNAFAAAGLLKMGRVDAEDLF